MVRRLAILAICVTACDHGERPAEPPDAEAVAAPVVEPVVTPAPVPEPVVVPAPPPVAAAPPRTPRVSARQRTEAFCRRHPVDYQPRCGGIGPLRIPMPPEDFSMRKNGPATPGPTRATWFASLSRAQQRYVDRLCHDEDNAMSDLCGGTPLVLVFDDAPVELIADDTRATDWPTARTPWLVTDTGELFHGFVPLAALDADRDGDLDRDDPAFATLQLWADRDGDRGMTPDELTPLSDRVTSLSLAYSLDARCDARLNCEGERAPMTWRDATGTHAGAIVDVYLHYH